MLEEDGNIVGFIGNIPVKFNVRGETKIAAASASWHVDPSVRGMTSIRHFKEYLNQSRVALFRFYNEKSDLLKVVDKLGFKEYTIRPHPMEYLYILDRAQFIHRKNLIFVLRRYFPKEDLNNFTVLSEILRKLGSFAYSYLFQTPSSKLRDPSDGLYTSTLCTHCDDSFTRLWDPHLESFDVAISRDHTTLNWLYFVAGRRYNRKVIQCHRTSDNVLVGYMVFDFLPWNASGGGAMQLMDMCILNSDRQVLASLISYAIEVGKENHAPILLLWTNNPDADSSLRKRIIIKWPVSVSSSIKFSGIFERDADAFNIHSV